MASAIRTMLRAQPAAEPWPPDDTEESVVGTDFHQMTIMNLRMGMNEVAHAVAAHGQPVPWQALSQIMVSGFARPDGTRFTMIPDVSVYHRPIDRNRGSVAISVDGPPILVVEVLSESTYDVDLDMERGKGYSYAAAGVHEYLTLDPTGLYLPERVRAWRLQDGTYHRWPAGEHERWYSQVLDLAIALDGEFASVYAGDGRRMLREGEIEEDRARTQTELARLRRLLRERGVAE